MTGCSTDDGVFLALRVRSDASALTEMFMARAPGLTYKGLPVCVCADGELIPTEIDAGEVIGIFGPPTHYYYGSTDQCWHLNAARFAKFKAEIRHAGSIKTEDAQPPRGGWFAPMLARQVELS